MGSLEDEGVLVKTLRSPGEIVGGAGSCAVIALTTPFVSAKLLQSQKTRDGHDGFVWAKNTEGKTLSTRLPDGRLVGSLYRTMFQILIDGNET